ncbi:hypothetical protein T492DRAFT_966484 [Pavlovales sp. CCMP2436]|nr:hypothetical protein T492DRAFT_966484 [Pavlovales sp. CCMP2436]
MTLTDLDQARYALALARRDVDWPTLHHANILRADIERPGFERCPRRLHAYVRAGVGGGGEMSRTRGKLEANADDGLNGFARLFSLAEQPRPRPPREWAVRAFRSERKSQHEGAAGGQRVDGQRVAICVGLQHAHAHVRAVVLGPEPPGQLRAGRGARRAGRGRRGERLARPPELHGQRRRCRARDEEHVRHGHEHHVP